MAIDTVEFAQRIGQKRVVTQDQMEEVMPWDESGNRYVRVDGRLVPLMPVGINRPQAEPNAGDAALAGLAATPVGGGTPSTIDHSLDQTPVKDQLDRPTCVSFALLAALEARIKRTQGLEMDLSEQYAHWLFMSRQGKNQCAQGPYTVQAAGFLHQAGVCEEALAPYQRLAQVTTNCAATPNPAASQQARYGLGSYSSLFDHGLTGWSICNTDLIESLLAQDLDVAVGFEGIFGLFDPNGILDVFLDGSGQPWPVQAGHSMLAVGYVRDPVNPYFLFKNSWVDAGGNGYMKVSYDYVREYATCGVVPHQVRTDMPV